MNEIDLIKEVEKRPILYDKSVAGFNRTKLRDEAWKEVQDALNVSESECKKRWRSLRDSFIKLRRTHGGRTRWPYHHAMRFLLPHVEPKGETGPSKKDEDSDPEDEIRNRALQALPDLSFGNDKFEDDEDSAPSPKKPRLNSTDEDTPCSQCNRTDPDELFLLSCAPILKRLNDKQNAKARLKIQQIEKDKFEDDEDAAPSPKKPRLNSTDEDTPCSQCNRTDPDELFLLSCAPILKRLNDKQNAKARLKIQQILYEAEFGTQMSMPFVGECFEGIEPQVE